MQVLRRVFLLVLFSAILVSSISLGQDRSASLLAQLKAARVISNLEPLVIGGHQVCPAAGNAKEQDMTTLDSRKNRVDIPARTLTSRLAGVSWRNFQVPHRTICRTLL